MNVHRESYPSFNEEDQESSSINLKEAVTFLQSYSALVSAHVSQLKAMKEHIKRYHCHCQHGLGTKIMEKEANLLFEKLLACLQQFMSETNGIKF